MKVAIIGAGDLGIQIAHFIENDTKDAIACFFDDFKQKGSLIAGIEVKGGILDIMDFYENGTFDKVICAIGYNHLRERERLCDELSKKGILFYTFIHSSALVDDSAIIGEGSVIYPGTIIDQRVIIGTHNILNLGVIISHDTIIGRSNFFAPNITVAGFCHIHSCCNIGMCTTIIDNISIISNVRIGAASLVLKPIIKEGLYVGSPCVRIK